MTDPISGEALRQRAQLAGIALHYTSFWGEHREVPATVIERALDAMGEHADTTAVPSAVLVTHGTASDVPLEAEGPWRLFTAETAERTLVCEGRGTAAQLPASLEMGYYALQAAGSAKERLVIVAPEHCWSPEPLRQGERWWGLSAQLYALRSERNWGIGDFSDLTDLVSIAAGQGAAFVGLSPLHALRADQPEAASPYSPSSRLALNTLFIDVAAVPEFMRSAAAQALFSDAAFQQRLGALRASDTVRYAEVTAAKQEMLSLLWDEFLRSEWEASSPRAEAFREFMQRNADVLGQHALYEAIQYHLHAIDPGVWGWPAWPEAMQDPHGAAVKAFAQEHAQQVRYRFWLQWLAHEQLDRVSQRARAMMPLGLYCDLAVGANDGGSETWTGQGLYAHGMRVGAPPDPLNHQGQDWGLPPMNPCALAASHFLPMRRLLKSVMRPAGALRMDHVMALMRLFWTSADGGTYVSYPLDALLAIMSIESHRQQCLVIGEDLGNVAPQMREAMAQRTLLSYRPLIFERVDGGAFRAPAHWPHQALAVVSTHDLPTLRGFWAAEDIDVQSRLGWLSAPDAHARALMDRAQDRVRLLIALNEEGLLPEGATADPQSVPEANADFAAAVHRYLARTPCWLAALQLEDVTGQLEQVNVPGSTEAMQPNWRRRLSVPLEKLATHACFSAIAAAMRAERGGAALPFSEALPALDTADIPLATYRVQFHEGNTFEQVTRAVPYLHALGISHLYSSPYLKAVPGSTHGYNVVDPTRLNPEVGSEATHAALCEALQAHGLSQVLDIVPNHMGVLDANNPWWQDVLEHGRASAHAGTFDIEWEPTAPDMHGRVLLPMLGGHYGRVLESGELQMAFDAKCGRFSVRYWDHELPIDPQHYARIFAAVAPPISGGDRDGDSLAQMQSLVDAFGNLPSRNTVDDNERAMRQRDAPLHQRRLAELAAEHPWVRQWIDALLTQWNGHKETPESFDALDQLLRDQAYRLADWRVAGDDINYRRFFDVNSLAAVRMEDPAVFEAAHACIFRWLAEGKISGLRIDHPDGLADPAQYFDRLQRRYASLARAAGREPRALYLIVEKILADHEPLPQDWPVHGATGYRFSSLVNGLFVEPASQAAFDDAYSAFTGDRKEFEEAVHECKKHIIETSLFSDLGWLADTLYNISRTDRKTCDFTRNQLRIALTEVAAVFPVYRTYIAPDGTGLSDTDRQHIEWAIASARRRMGTAEGGVLAYLQGVFIGTEGQHAPELRGAFLRRWQQFTAPVMAKSVEDTAFYRYVRLVSLNDVGSEPRRFGLSGAAFHQANLQRSRRLPHGLLATSTHDSKRSEDLRARLNVLSEIPALWEDTAIQLRELGTRFTTEVDGVTVPSAHDLWALYQALVGIWPAGGADAQERISLRERVKEYMVKAMREAKQATNWLFPNEAYEAAVHRYIDGALSTERFVRELEKFVQAVAPYGFQNSLCQLALKLTVPGVPDIYQGCEQWNFSLVDPDNRRPVDFEALERSLEQVQSLYAQGYPSVQAWTDMLTAVPDAKVKQLVTWRLLQLRQKMPDLFLSSTYLPLTIEGPSAEHAVAFARIRDGKAMVVICSRLLYGLTEMGWRGTRFAIAPAHPVLGKVARWKNWVTGATMAAEVEDGIEIETLMGEAQPQGGALPFVVLVPEDIE